MDSRYLLHRCGPGQCEAEEDDEEGTSEIPVPERLAWVLAVWFGEDDELEVANEAGEAALDGVPDGLGERVGRGPEAVGRDGNGDGSGRGGAWGTKMGTEEVGTWEWRLGGCRGRGRGDGDGSARREGQPRGGQWRMASRT
jgi:hypothetical protein